MIYLLNINDENKVKQALLKDNLCKDIVMCEDLDNWIPDIRFNNWYAVIEDHSLIGLFVTRQVTDNCVTFHGGLYKEFRRQDTPSKLQEIISTLKQEFPSKYMTTVNSNNQAVIKLLQKSNFIHKTTITEGCKNGDLLIFAED